MDSSEIPLDGPRLSPALTRQQLCFAFDNTFARLPERFYVRLDPTSVAAPRIVKVNAELARELGLMLMRSQASRVLQFSPATGWPANQSRSRWPMPGISLGTLCLNSATGYRNGGNFEVQTA